MRRIVIGAVALGLVLGACGTAVGAQHKSASHPAAHPAAMAHAPAGSPEIAADKALCKVWSANIGGDSTIISLAVVTSAGTATSKLADDITKALNTTGLQPELDAQIHVAFDCALAKNGVTPR